ncbi:SPOSA6832_04239 [Sporobolomyces salmonicolor]|uniref:O-acyltransferase n=1 Tax=Sporidiobolus salmonicolor TaxID=5005 RepID=A0A0D6ERF2_SPOSA|nr:SPOSA6832_04239 [Sporobolomyces salmonicolor]
MTTITTVTAEGGEATTETITHVGADSVTANYSKETGQITLKPIPARGGDPASIKIRRSRRTHFTPRISHFDRDNATSAQDTFRGFWTLFWIVMAVAGLRSVWRRFSESGGLYRWTFAELISQDAVALAMSDAVMAGSTLLCVPFVKLLVSGWIPYYRTGLIIQHLGQTLFLAVAKARELKRNEEALDAVIQEHGGWNKTEQAARQAWEEACRDWPPPDSALASPKPARSTLIPSSSSSAVSNERADATIRHRTPSIRRRSSDHGEPVAPRRAEKPHEGIDTLTWHPDERISKLAIAIAEEKEFLTSGGVKNVTFPANVTFANFIDYLFVPTLVYELEYPRTASIRPLYVFEKTLATFGTFTLLILIVEHAILPVTPSDGDSFFASMLDLAVPFTACYLLIFFIIFGWNSTTFDEFSRRWNVPVHTFLLRHVYASTMSTYHFSKFQAAFVTFFLSACVHELVMAVVTKKIRLYLFMLQLPLIMVGRLRIFRRHPALGNLFFWLGLLSGFPLLAVAYIRY